MKSNTGLILTVFFLLALQFSLCTSSCSIRSFTATQTGDSIFLDWTVHGKCLENTYVIRYYNEYNKQDKYLKGLLRDKNTEIRNPVPCIKYTFILVPYRGNKKELTSRYTSLITNFKVPSAPLQPEIYSNRNRLEARWKPPEKNPLCLKFYAVDVFRVMTLNCENVNCMTIVYSQNTTNLQIPLNNYGAVCGNYRVYIRSNYGNDSSDASIAKVDFNVTNTNEDQNIDWSEMKFTLTQEPIYFRAQFQWTLPRKTPYCFPQFEIEYCPNMECDITTKKIPAYLQHGFASIEDLKPGTLYSVHFKIKSYNNNHLNEISMLSMTTEEIPGVENFRLIGTDKYFYATLQWTIPQELSNLKSLFSLVLKESGNLYENTTISPNDYYKILQLKPCLNYTFLMSVLYNGYLSRPSSVHIQNPEPSDNPLSDLKLSSLSPTQVHLSWTSKYSSCFPYFNVKYSHHNEDTQSITVKSTEVDIIDLLPCTSYRFDIYAVNSRGEFNNTKSSFIEIKPPQEGPLLLWEPEFNTSNNVTVSVTLRWVQSQNSCVKSYEVFSRDISKENGFNFQVELENSINNVTIWDLPACSKFEYSIRTIQFDHRRPGQYVYRTFDTPPLGHLLAVEVTNVNTFYAQIKWIVIAIPPNGCSPTAELMSFCTDTNQLIQRLPGLRYIVNETVSETGIAVDKFMKSTRTYIDQYNNLWPQTIYNCRGILVDNGKQLKSRSIHFFTLPKNDLQFEARNEKSLLNSVCEQFPMQCNITNIYNLKRNQRSSLDYLYEILKSIYSIVPEAPKNVTISMITKTSVKFSWSMLPSPLNVTQYLLYISNVRLNYYVPNGCVQKVQNSWSVKIPGDRTTYLLEGLQPYMSLEIQIRATIGQGIGLYSTPLPVTTLPSVPEKVRFLKVEIEQNKTVVKWYAPCMTNGVVSHYLLTATGSRPHHPPDPQRVYSISKNENLDSYEQVLENLLPEYVYEVKISAVVHNVPEINISTEKFQTPAGVPPEPNMTSVLFTVYSVEDSSVTFNDKVFSDDQGVIRYYALLLAPNDFVEPPKHGLLDINGEWPKENTWAEAAQQGGNVSYQVTPLNWYPFTNSQEILYIIGDNNCSLVDTKTFCNGPMIKKTKYSLRIRAFTSRGYRDSSSVNANTRNSLLYSEIALVSTALVGVLIVLVIVFIIFTGSLIKSKFVKAKKAEEKIEQESSGPSPPLPAKNFLPYCNDILDSKEKIKAEFDLLVAQSGKLIGKSEIASLPHNKGKNRYANIQPYDSNRVVLEGDPESNYINASYIKFQGSKTSKYIIACQAPKKETCYDFWRMIWQCKIDVIVMLCNLVEKEKEKCHKYFPEAGETVSFNDFSVLCKEQNDYMHQIHRVFIVTKDGVLQTIHHFQYVDWPDFGIPSSPEIMLAFFQTLRVVTKDTQPTVAVHCSAGVGRTGTFIALAILLKHLRHNRKLSVFYTVLQMREERAHMVQTMDQYEYIYKVLKFAMEHQKSKRPSFIGLFRFAVSYVTGVIGEKPTHVHKASNQSETSVTPLSESGDN